jgi:ELWxxDGT repeat protein
MGTLMVNAGGTLYFAGSDGVLGSELWKSDGTTAGTVLVADINTPGTAASSPTLFTVWGTKVLFAATTTAAGQEPYISDGTPAGTLLLKDCYPLASSSSPQMFMVSGAKAFFSATDGTAVTGTLRELYVTDGTPAGTSLVLDLFPGLNDGFPIFTGGIAPYGAGVVFRGLTAANGSEPYFSDGTPGGTVLIKDLTPGPASASPGPFANVGGTIYFQGTDATVNWELWKTDATAAGTLLVKEITPGITASLPANFTPFGAGFLFTATEVSATGLELWFSNGTTAGTVLVKDINTLPGAAVGGGGATHAVLNNKLYFAPNDGIVGNELWVSDGTPAGTVLVKDINTAGTSAPAGLYAYQGKIYFSANDLVAGIELFVSDGTAAGTVLVKDINPGFASSSPTGFIGMGGKVYFGATDATNGRELWVTDGTAAGTSLVLDIYAGVSSGFATNNLTVLLGGKLYFPATTAANGTEYWTSDGTAVGTTMITDLNVGAASGAAVTSVTNAVLGGKLYFTGTTAATGTELFVTDGTPAGTVVAVDLAPTTTSSSPSNLYSYGGKLYMGANAGGGLGVEPYVTDGTLAGTVLLMDMNPAASSSTPQWFTGAGDRVFFLATDSVAGFELRVTDGTPAGTSLVLDIQPGTGTGVAAQSAGLQTFLTPIGIGRRIAFCGWAQTVSGQEIWTSDGTAAGTTMLTDLFPGTGAGCPVNSPFTVIGQTAFLVLSNGVTGFELYKMSTSALGASEIETFGTGCAGTAGIPAIGASGVPSIGNAAFGVTLSSARPSSACALVLALNRADLAIGFGCTVYPSLVPPISVNMVTDALGQTTLNLPIPAPPSNAGFNLYFQWVVADPSGAFGPGGVALSNGLRVQTGKS